MARRSYPAPSLRKTGNPASVRPLTRPGALRPAALTHRMASPTHSANCRPTPTLTIPRASTQFLEATIGTMLSIQRLNLLCRDRTACRRHRCSLPTRPLRPRALTTAALRSGLLIWRTVAIHRRCLLIRTPVGITWLGRVQTAPLPPITLRQPLSPTTSSSCRRCKACNTYHHPSIYPRARRHMLWDEQTSLKDRTKCLVVVTYLHTAIPPHCRRNRPLEFNEHLTAFARRNEKASTLFFLYDLVFYSFPCTRAQPFF
jgi:hypothetical protein